MKRNSGRYIKKTGALCLAIILVLGAIGAVYAGWAQGITVNAETDTGWYDVTFDSFTAPVGGTNQTAFSATAVDAHNYEISLVNLYPGCDAQFTFVLKNNGTIPAKITDIKLNDISEITQSLDLNCDTAKDVTITILDISTITTLEPGASVTGHLLVHTWKAAPGGDANDAAPNASGSFTLEIDTMQNG
jgi:hypothetical protein